MGHIAKAASRIERQTAGDFLPGDQSRKQKLRARSKRFIAAPKSAARTATRCWCACRSIRTTARGDRRSEDRRHRDGQNPLRQAGDRLRLVPRSGRFRSRQDLVPIVLTINNDRIACHDGHMTMEFNSMQLTLCVRLTDLALASNWRLSLPVSLIAAPLPRAADPTPIAINPVVTGRTGGGRHQAAGQGAGRAGSSGGQGRHAGSAPARRSARSTTASRRCRRRRPATPLDARHQALEGRRRNPLLRSRSRRRQGRLRNDARNQSAGRQGDHRRRSASGQARMGQAAVLAIEKASNDRSSPSTKPTRRRPSSTRPSWRSSDA